MSTVTEPKKRRRNEIESAIEKRFADAGEIPDLCRRLQSLKRQRDGFIKSRIMIFNRLCSQVAVLIGYNTGKTEEEREQDWTRCKAIVKSLLSNKAAEGEFDDVEAANIDDDTKAVIGSLALAINTTLERLVDYQTRHENVMIRIAEQLPAFEWVSKFRGVGPLSLANVVGEAGDLSNYPNPAKLWARMGCAPFEKDGEVHMAKAWKIDKWHSVKLSAEEWSEYGYCPRRRSVVYNISASIKRSCFGKNSENEGANNELSRRYTEAKAKAAILHPDWTPAHCDAHAMLLCGKRFLRDLWNTWNGIDPATFDHDAHWRRRVTA